MFLLLQSGFHRIVTVVLARACLPTLTVPPEFRVMTRRVSLMLLGLLPAA